MMSSAAESLFVLIVTFSVTRQLNPSTVSIHIVPLGQEVLLQLTGISQVMPVNPDVQAQEKLSNELVHKAPF